MRRTALVAGREYVDNIRTKTFWIGILSVPVLLCLVITVSVWLAERKDLRKYAVVDHSGWLLESVERRADSPDLAKVFEAVVEKYREGGESFEELPQVLKTMAPGLATFDEKQLQMAADGIARLQGPEGVGILRQLEPLASKLTGQQVGDLREPLKAFLEEVRTWWESLPPDEAELLAPGASKTRYQRIDVGGEAALSELNEKISSGELFAYFVIGADPIEGNEGCRYISNNLTDERLKRWFQSLATEEVRAQRLLRERIDPKVSEWIQRPLRFEGKKLSEEGEEETVRFEDRAHHFAPIFFVYVLWMAIFTISQMLLMNTIEEKSNRIIEVLLSSVSPLELMIGKIAGIAATGLTVVGSWVIFFLIAVEAAPHLFERMPDIDLLSLVNDPVYLASFVSYFLLGYFFYASLLVGLGSVCNSIKEAQNLMFPVVLFLVMPLLAMMPIAEDPNGTLARVLSFVPPFTPFVMMNRAAAPPEPWEYVATTLLMLPSIAAVMWAAAKVFRIGILLTGKPPSIFEILRWIRAPVR